LAKLWIKMAEAEALHDNHSYVGSVQLLESDLRQIQTPNVTERSVALVTLCDKVRFAYEKRNEKSFFNQCLPHLLRLKSACPLQDVRTSISGLLDELQTKGLALPLLPQLPSLLDTGKEFDFLFNVDHRSTSYLTDLFYSTGRVSHLDLFLSIIPTYAEEFIMLRHTLMNLEGPLPHDQRHYIAIMAASRYNCEYLVKLHSFMFLEFQGDPTWLEDLSKAPPKLQKLSELNAVLAHQPWKMKKELISSLLDESPVWRPPELIQAVMILTFFHMSCGLVEGFHISPELDLFALDRSQILPVIKEHSGVINAADQELLREEEETIILHALLSKLRLLVTCSGIRGALNYGEENIKIVSDSESENMNLDPFFSVGDMSMEYQLVADSLDTSNPEVRIKCKQDPAASPGYPKPANSPTAVAKKRHVERPEKGDLNFPLTQSMQVRSKANHDAIAQFRGGNNMTHKDIDMRSTKQLKHYDFSWEVQGFPLVDRYYRGFAQVLDNEFKTLAKLTDGKLNDKAIDTSPLRVAISHFASGIYGIQDDMYDYHKVNVFLSIPLKTHLKWLVCDPQRIQGEDLPLTLKLWEKLHLSCIALSAKRKSCLLWALSVIYSATR